MSFIKILPEDKEKFTKDFKGFAIDPILTDENFYILNSDILQNENFKEIHEDLKKCEIIENFKPLKDAEEKPSLFSNFFSWVKNLFTS